MSDPKSIILDIIDTIATTIDNNITPASILFMYEGGPETLKYLFYDEDYDVVVSIGDPAVRTVRDIQDVPEHYPSNYPVHVVTVDKYDGAGVLIATASKMQWKMRAAMRVVVEAAAQNDLLGYTLKILTENSRNRRTGGIDRVWESTYTLEFKDY